jgi:hypothetical protein
MFSIDRLYNSVCSFAPKAIRIQPFFISMILHHHKHLMEMKEELGIKEGSTHVI